MAAGGGGFFAGLYNSPFGQKLQDQRARKQKETEAQLDIYHRALANPDLAILPDDPDEVRQHKQAQLDYLQQQVGKLSGTDAKPLIQRAFDIGRQVLRHGPQGAAPAKPAAAPGVPPPPAAASAAPPQDLGNGLTDAEPPAKPAVAPPPSPKYQPSMADAYRLANPSISDKIHQVRQALPNLTDVQASAVAMGHPPTAGIAPLKPYLGPDHKMHYPYRTSDGTLGESVSEETAMPTFIKYSPKTLGSQLPAKALDMDDKPISAEDRINGNLYSSPDGGLHYMQVGNDLAFKVIGNRTLAVNRHTGETMYDLGQTTLGSSSQRQVLGQDAEGNPIFIPMESSKTPVTAPGKVGPTAQAPAAIVPPPPSATSAAPAAPVAAPRPATPAGKAIASSISTAVAPSVRNPGPVMAKATPAPGMSTTMFKTASDRAMPVFNAASQLFGDPQNPEFKPLASYMDIADSKKNADMVGNALRLTFSLLDKTEKDSGSLVTLLKNYGGVTGAVAASENVPLQDALAQLKKADPSGRLVDAYNAEMAGFEQYIGMRAINKASGTQFSIKALQSTYPLLGINTQSSRDFASKLVHNAEEIHRVTRFIPGAMLPEKSFFDSKVAEMASRAGNKSVAPPPGGGKPATASSSVIVVSPEDMKR